MEKGFKLIMGIVMGIGLVAFTGCSTLRSVKEELREKKQEEKQEEKQVRDEERRMKVEEVRQSQVEAITTHLEEKYGEPFEVVDIDRRTDVMRPGTILAECHNKAEEPIKFIATLNEETGEVKDKYLAELVGKNEESTITEYMQSIWENCHVYVYNDTGMTYPTETDRNMTRQEFYKIYGGSSQMVVVYIEGPNHKEEIDQQAEIEKFREVTQWLKEKEYFKTYCSFMYLESEAYSQYEEIKEREYFARAYYLDYMEPSIFASIGMKIDGDGEIEKSQEELEKNFKTWIKEMK